MAVTTDSDDAPTTLSLTPPVTTSAPAGAPGAGDGTGGMAWPDELLPAVLPTERLNAKGMAVPELRAELRRIPNVRNAFNVLSLWVQSFGLIALVCWATPQLPLALALPIWVATFLLMGRAFALYAILG